ncbi:hypothetical protein BGZ68_002115 [Mortierella alpina]|nr:hypothetical protein BGZ68_002115 [Mortierella alpina]
MLRAWPSVPKKPSLVNIKSVSSQIQDEKDALTIYIRNVTESITYEMLHDAFSAFGVIRTLNVVHPKACAFVEFTTSEAHQKALAATSVPVGNLQAVYTPHTVSTAAGLAGNTHSKLNHKGAELTKEDEGCDLTAAC